MDNSKEFSDFLSHVKSKDKVDWQQVRIQASISSMHGILSNEVRHEEALGSSPEELTEWARVAIDAVDYADALVKELKGE